MRQRVLWLIAAGILIVAGVWVYSQYFSPTAQIRAASSAFMQTAVSGDEAAIGNLLAPDSPMTAAEIAQLYRGHTFQNYNVYPIKAFPNRSGVTWLANTSTLDLSSPGHARGTTLAFKPVNGRWLVYKAGAGFSL